jgi:hypothetical protein
LDDDDQTTCQLFGVLAKKYIKRTTQVKRSDWNEYWYKLIKEKIAEPADREQFDRDFTNTARRDSASPRPGILCRFVWTLAEAEHLDARGQLLKRVNERINQLLKALEEDKIDPDGPSKA